MMNLFDLSANMAGSKKGFGDGSFGGRNRLTIANKAVDPNEIRPDHKPFTCESMKSFSGRKSSAKPMKMLIAQEMSKEMDFKRKSPNVVARLMGLDDALPGDSSVHPSKSSGLIHAEVKLQSHGNESKDCRDVYEIHHRPSKSSSFNDQVLQKDRHNENQNEKRMALVRDKFMEAKRLATDEKLLDSKEFHDALEVLSSNRDLFLKFLDEPNSLFSSHLEELRPVPPTQTKHITVLKPSKTSEVKSKVKQQQYAIASEMPSSLWYSNFNHRPMIEKLSQPTRIVVLKPSPRKFFDTNSPTSPTTPAASSPELLERGDCDLGVNTQDSVDLIEESKNIDLQMYDGLSRHRRDESLLSSVFSNGYVGDDSSFNRSDNYVGGESNNIDSEISSSWDYMSNRYGSPCSHSSLSRASYSPESSVIREAKKRLSERWALVASNELFHEKLQGRRSSSTLGEMLAINALKMENWTEDFKSPATRLSTDRMNDGNGDDLSAINLSRSKSVPTSSLTYESVVLCTEDSGSWAENSVVPKGTAKSKSGKTSLKGRVSSLFFSKNKKGGREGSISSQIDGFRVDTAETIDNKLVDSSQTNQIHVSEPSTAGNLEAESILISSPVAPMIKMDESKTSPKIVLSLEEPGPSNENQETLRLPEKLNENQDHPSPTSTLDAPFKDDSNEIAPNSSKLSTSDNPQALSRSPPIESISRTLSWDESCSKVPSTSPLKLSRALCKAWEDDPEDLMLVQNLLAASGLCKNSLSTIFDGWHSPDIPLDPKLLEKLSDSSGEVAKNRKRRSNQKLIFDCVNVVLREIASSAEQGAFQRLPGDEALLAGKVWPFVKKKLGEAENGSVVVDKLLGREVAGSAWTELVQAEMAAISSEIGVRVLDDLFGEVLMELNVC